MIRYRIRFEYVEEPYLKARARYIGPQHSIPSNRFSILIDNKVEIFISKDESGQFSVELPPNVPTSRASPSPASPDTPAV